MEEIIARALEAADAAGSVFAEARFVSTRVQSIEVRNGIPTVVDSESEGLGVRAFVTLGPEHDKGALASGFSSSSGLGDGPQAAERVAREAVTIAKASSLAAGEGLRLDETPAAHGEYHTPVEKDPLEVDLAEKLGRLTEAAGLLGKDSRLKVAQAFFTCRRDE